MKIIIIAIINKIKNEINGNSFGLYIFTISNKDYHTKYIILYILLLFNNMLISINMNFFM